MYDWELAELAVSRGWLSAEDSESALAEADRCQSMGLVKSLGEVLIDQGLLTTKQVDDLRGELGGAVAPRLGGFEMIRRVGLGGTGSVFEARHTRLDRRVALKVLYPRYANNPKFTRLFLREARVLARLNHPNLVHAVDAGCDRGFYFIAMEYVEGENLQQRVARGGRLDPDESLRIVEAVCLALEALAREGIVHRDVKPSNVLLSTTGEIKLADLGLTGRQRGEEPQKHVGGTPHYLSPERARGESTGDLRGDIYSLGATWYHLLSGQPPFLGSSSREILRAHSIREVVSLREFRTDVPMRMENVIRRWMAKQPQERPQSIAEALVDLKRLQPPRRSRSRPVSSSLALVVVAVLGIAIVVGYLATVADDEPPTTTTHLIEPSPIERSSLTPPPSRAVPIATSHERDLSIAVDTELADRVHESVELEPRAEAAELSSVEPTSKNPVSRRGPFSALASASERWLEYSKQRIRQGWDDRWDGPLSEIAERFAPFRPLVDEFHAHRTGILVRPKGGGVLAHLEYSFRSADELRDFRIGPGSVTLDSGLRTASAVTPVLHTVYWLVPPIDIYGRSLGRTGLSIGFADVRFTLTSSARPIILREPVADVDLRGEPLILKRPTNFHVRLGGEGALVTVGQQRYENALELPGSGRVLLYVASGGLESLHIRGTIEPNWLDARLKILSR